MNEDYAQIGGALGVRRLGAALVAHFDSSALIGENPPGLSFRESAKSKTTTKAVPSNRTPRAVAIFGSLMMRALHKSDWTIESRLLRRGPGQALHQEKRPSLRRIWTLLRRGIPDE